MPTIVAALSRLPVRRLLPPAVGLVAVLAVRPGVVVNGVRSPLAWLAVAGVVLLSVAVPAGSRRLGASARTSRLAGSAVVAVAVVALLAPSFRQRTLYEELPVPSSSSSSPVAVAGQAGSSTSPSEAPGPAQAPPSGPAPSGPAPAGPAPSGPAPADRPAAVTVAAPPPAPAVVPGERRGTLEGIGHSARGGVGLRVVDGVAYLVFEDIDVEGTVGPSVHLVDPGARTPGGGVRVGALEAERGTFSTRLPASVDPRRAWSVLVWCDPYDTPIAVADLSA